MAISFNDNIKVLAPKPVDAKYLNSSNVPYSATTEVNSSILASERHIGLTVNINNVEYWYATGTTDGDLIEKTLTVQGDGVVTGATYVGSILSLQRSEGLSDVSVSIGVSGITDGVVSGGTLNGGTLQLERTIGLPDVNIDISALSGSTITGVTEINNVGSGTGEIFSNLTTSPTGATAELRTIAGSGNTSVITSGDTIVISSQGSGSGKEVLITTGITIAIPDTSINTIYISSGTTGYTLPALPQTGAEITFVDELGTAGTISIIIDGNGNNIKTNVDTSALINSDFGSLTVVYNGYKWNVTAFVS